jgi:hypothetical protein
MMNEVNMTNTDRSITKIYMGLDRHCRCGCGGEYVEIGKPKFEKRLKRFNSLLAAAELSSGDNTDSYINVSYGNNRAMTAYFD